MRNALKIFMLFVLTISMPLALRCQTAKVEVLSKADAEKAQQTYLDLKKAQEAWDTLQAVIGEKYLTVNSDDPRQGYNYIHVSGFSGGTLSIGGNVTTVACSAILMGCPDEVVETKAAKESKEARKKAEEQAAIKEHKTRRYYRRDWGDSLSFQFSSDFKFIVPAPATIDKSNDCTHLSNWGGCSIMLTPNSTLEQVQPCADYCRAY